jgi:hypothetical protein
LGDGLVFEGCQKLRTGRREDREERREDGEGRREMGGERWKVEEGVEAKEEEKAQRARNKNLYPKFLSSPTSLYPPAKPNWEILNLILSRNS